MEKNEKDWLRYMIIATTEMTATPRWPFNAARTYAGVIQEKHQLQLLVHEAPHPELQAQLQGRKHYVSWTGISQPTILASCVTTAYIPSQAMCFV